MTNFTKVPKQVEDILEKSSGTTSRRDFLKNSGLFVVSLSAASLLPVTAGAQGAAAQAAGRYPDPDFRQLDAWIVILENYTATFYVCKTDGGQGTGTSFRKMMCDEMDLGYDQSSLIMGSTELTVDQGGSGGSDAIETDAPPMRRVAAEARRVLLGMAATRFNTTADQLAVSEGVITVRNNPAQKVTYG